MSETRGVLELTTVQNMVMTMSEGNPGSITAMMEVLEADPIEGMMILLDLDDMNMWGGQIWVGFKYFAEGDVAKFVKAAQDRDPEMVKLVNEHMGLGGPGRYKAVIAGASGGDRPRIE